jgi:hypothetical protein
LQRNARATEGGAHPPPPHPVVFNDKD